MVRYFLNKKLKDLDLTSAIVCAWRLDHLAYLKSNMPALLDGCRILPLTIDVWAEVKRHNANYLSFWDFYNYDDLVVINETAWRLTNRWFKDFENLCTFEGLSIPYLDFEAQKWFIRDAIYLKKIFQLIIKTTDFSAFITCGEPSKPSLFYNPNDTPAAILKYLCEQNAIKFIALNQKRSYLGLKIVSLLKKKINRWRKFAISQLSTSPTEEELSNQRTDRPKLGMNLHGLGFGMEFADIAAKNNFEVVIFTKNGWSANKRKLPLSDVKYYDISGCFDAPVSKAYKKIFRKAWHCFKKRSLDHNIDFPEIFNNPYLDYHHQFYFNFRWPQIAFSIKNIDDVIKNLELDCFITSNLTDADNWVIVECCKKNKIPTLLSLHSGWPDPYILFDRANRVLVWTHSHRKEVEKKSKVVADVVGLGYTSMQCVNPENDSQKDPNLLERFGISSNDRVILLVSNSIHTGLFPVLEVNHHLTCLAELFSIPARWHGKLKIVVKCKPNFDHRELYFSLKHLYDKTGSVEIVDDVSINDALAVCNMVVLTNVTTTAYLEAVLKKKLTFFIENTPLVYCGQPEIPSGCVTKIRLIEDIWPTINKYLDNPELIISQADEQHVALLKDLPKDSFESNFMNTLNSICRVDAKYRGAATDPA